MRRYEVQEFGQPLKAHDYPTPTPAGAEVLLRVRAAGVCHSDLHIWEGGYDLGQGKRLSLKDRGIALPLAMGHETVGEVVALGPDATGVAVGDIRLVYPWIGCGGCAVCLAGSENLCADARFLGVHRHGGYAEQILVPHARYLVDIGDLTPAEMAPYACSGLTTFSALKKIPKDILAREPIIVIGAGGLGLMCTNLIGVLGGRAILVDIDPAKRAAAIAAGAIAAIDGSAADALDQLKAAAGGMVWAIIDCVGAPATVKLGFDALAKGGQLIIIGLFGGETNLPIPLIPMRAITIQGSYVGNLAELKELVALVRAKRIPPIPITRRPLDQADAALADLHRGKVIGRTVLEPAG
ncbi:MAG: alcohol dehydrogenase [Rhodospirillales bacterium]|nr:alcohol dehydrogenase [Rhodospirillales bacterium]